MIQFVVEGLTGFASRLTWRPAEKRQARLEFEVAQSRAAVRRRTPVWRLTYMFQGSKNTPSPEEITWMTGWSAARHCAGLSAFIALTWITFRQSMLRNLSTQAQIIGSNSISALLFNDPQSAENTLLALTAARQYLVRSGLPDGGRPLCSYHAIVIGHRTVASRQFQ